MRNLLVGMAVVLAFAGSAPAHAAIHRYASFTERGQGQLTPVRLRGGRDKGGSKPRRGHRRSASLHEEERVQFTFGKIYTRPTGAAASDSWASDGGSGKPGKHGKGGHKSGGH